MYTLAQDKTTKQMVEMKAEMVPILVVLTTYALRGTGSKSINLSSNKQHIILTSLLLNKFIHQANALRM